MPVENITGVTVDSITDITVENVPGFTLDNITDSTVENVTIMYVEPTQVSIHAMWIPYIALVILFLIGLALSFRRHHIRQVKKRRYIVEYQEESLSVRKPRIQGKLGHHGLITGTIPPTILMTSPGRMSSAMGNNQNDGNYHPLQPQDIHLSFFPDVTRGKSYGVKRRYRSETELDNQNKSYYRLLSDDDYFRRKGPRDSYYIKSTCERHVSPGRNRQRVHVSDNAQRSFWVRSDVNNQGTEAVKYIKVFDLDLCTDCRLYVERVDSSRTSEHSDNLIDMNNHSPSDNLNLWKSSSDIKNTNETKEDPSSCEFKARTDPQISIAQIHSPPNSDPAYFQPVLSASHGSPELLRCAGDFSSNQVFSEGQQPERNGTSGRHNGSIEIQLSPLDVERPRSAPDLYSEGKARSDYFKRGMQDSAFKLRPQFSFNPRRQAPSPQRRTRGRDKSGVFWLDLDTHQHTLV